VTGAAYGAMAYDKLNTAYMYGIKIGLGIEVVIAISTFLLAPFITLVFTQAEGAARISSDLELFLRIVCIYYPGVAFGMLSSSMFQGAGKGMNALLVTLLRTIILTPLVVVILSIVLDMNLTGVWWGLVVANIAGSMVAFLWGKLYVRNLMMSGQKKLLNGD